MARTVNQIFSQAQYMSIAEKAAQYFRENPKAQAIPLVKTLKPDTFVYRHRDFGDAQASYGTHEWSSGGTKAKSKHQYEDYPLESVEMELMIPKSNITLYTSENLLGEARSEQIRKWVDDVDNAIFHGVIPEYSETQSSALNDGLCDRAANTVIDMSSAADEKIKTKGEIYHTINNLITEFPFRIRETNPGIICFVSEDIDAAVRAPDRIYQDKNEWEMIYDNFIGDKASPARRIASWIPTNKILAKAYDDTAGVNADTVDTLGTHSRIMMIINNPKLVARVVSRNFSLLGEETKMLEIHQGWGWRGAGCVFEEDAIKYTEALNLAL